MKDCLFCYEKIQDKAKKCRFCLEFVKEIKQISDPDMFHHFERLDLKEIRKEAETKAINRAIKLSEGVMSKTALLLNVTRPTLYSLIEKYDIIQVFNDEKN